MLYECNELFFFFLFGLLTWFVTVFNFSPVEELLFLYISDIAVNGSLLIIVH